MSKASECQSWPPIRVPSNSRSAYRKYFKESNDLDVKVGTDMYQDACPSPVHACVARHKHPLRHWQRQDQSNPALRRSCQASCFRSCSSPAEPAPRPGARASSSALTPRSSRRAVHTPFSCDRTTVRPAQNIAQGCAHGARLPAAYQRMSQSSSPGRRRSASMGTPPARPVRLSSPFGIMTRCACTVASIASCLPAPAC